MAKSTMAMFKFAIFYSQRVSTESMPLLEVIHIQQLFPSLPHHHAAAVAVAGEADHAEVPEVGNVEVAVLDTRERQSRSTRTPLTPVMGVPRKNKSS